MSLTQLLRSIANDMLTPGKLLGDIPGPVTYYSASDGNATTYDPYGVATTRNEVTGVILTGVTTDPTYDQLDGINVFPQDKFFILSGDAFLKSGLSYRRKPGDRLVDGTESWEVVGIRSDPIHATFTIHLRKP